MNTPREHCVMEGESPRVLRGRMPGTTQPLRMASGRVRRVLTPLRFNNCMSGLPLLHRHPRNCMISKTLYPHLTPRCCHGWTLVKIVTLVQHALDACVASRQVRGPDQHVWDKHPPGVEHDSSPKVTSIHMYKMTVASIFTTQTTGTLTSATLSFITSSFTLLPVLHKHVTDSPFVHI